MFPSPVTETDLPEITAFCLAQPWRTEWPQDMLDYFFNHLISSPDLIIDLHDNEKRIAVGIVLDKIINKGNHANFHILAMAPEAEEFSVIDIALRLAKDKLPSCYDKLFFSLAADTQANALIASHGFIPYFQTYELHNSDYRRYAQQDDAITLVQEADFPELYDAIKHIFSNSLDFSLASYDDWLKRRKSESTMVWLLKEHGKIAAFLQADRSVVQNAADIHLIGVFLTWQRQGMATRLLRHALHYFSEHGAAILKLHVSAENPSALTLYQKLGFTSQKRFDNYLWTRPFYKEAD